MSEIILPVGVGVSDPDDMATIRAARHEIYVSTQFSAHDLMVWWQTWHHDPVIVGAYLDPLPDRLDDFLALAASERLYFALIYYRGAIMGASWLHDLSENDGIRSGWMGHYHMPEFRGVTGLRARDQIGFFYLMQSIDIPSIHAACRTSNMPARRAIHSSGFNLVGHIDAFAAFGGEWDSAEIFTLRPEDAAECMRLAHLRSEAYRRRSLQPPT